MKKPVLLDFQRYELIDRSANHYKYYEGYLFSDFSVVFSYGRISKSRTTLDAIPHKSRYAAERTLQEKLSEKFGKGYHKITGPDPDKNIAPVIATNYEGLTEEDFEINKVYIDIVSDIIEGWIEHWTKGQPASLTEFNELYRQVKQLLPCDIQDIGTCVKFLSLFSENEEVKAMSVLKYNEYLVILKTKGK